jgi:hypothetical protein
MLAIEKKLYMVGKRSRMYRMLGAKWESYEDDACARVMTPVTFRKNTAREDQYG